MEEQDDSFFRDFRAKPSRKVHILLVCVQLVLAVIALVFFLFAKEGQASPDGTSCFAIKDLSRKWSAWTEEPLVESFKTEDVGSQMATWFQWGFILFALFCAFFGYLLFKITFAIHPDLSLSEQIAPCCGGLASIVWYVAGLAVRYDRAGRTCAETYLVKAGRAMDVYYSATLGITVVCVCACLYVVRN